MFIGMDSLHLSKFLGNIQMNLFNDRLVYKFCVLCF